MTTNPTTFTKALASGSGDEEQVRDAVTERGGTLCIVQDSR